MLESWKGIATSISASPSKSKLMFLEVVDIIITKEIRKNEEGFSNLGSTSNMESRGRNENKGNGHDGFRLKMVSQN